MPISIANKNAMKRSKLFYFVLIFSLNSISTCYSADNLNKVPLKGLSADDNSVVEIDSADDKPNENKPSIAVSAPQIVEPGSSINVDNAEQTTISSPNVEPPTASPSTIEPKTIEMPEEPEPPDTTFPESPKQDLGEKAAHFVSHLPQRLGLFAVNAVVAIPATFVRRSVEDTASNTKELIDDHKNPILLIPAGTLSLYYGVTSGLVEGATFGIINSWKHSTDKNISKASLGLQESK